MLKLEYFFKSLFIKIFICLIYSVIFVSLSWANGAVIDGAKDEDALMIVRFNNDSVYYTKQMATLIDKAKSIQPNCYFSFVIVPPSDNKDVFCTKISQQINDMMKLKRVDKNNYNISYSQNALKFPELRMFVLNNVNSGK